MKSFIHCADIHLDSPLHKLDAYEGAPVEALRRATTKAFENLVDTAISHEVDFLLISGDLYDGSWKDYSTALFFTEQMTRLMEKNIPVFIISGNHDAASKMTKSLKLPAMTRLLSTKKPETVVLEDIGVAIHGQGFSTPAITHDLSVHYPEPLPGMYNIGMLHTALNDTAYHEPYAPCSVEGLKRKGYDYWALGHIHTRQVVAEDPWVVFPGNLQGRHIRETGPKGCIRVFVDEAGNTSINFLPVDVLRWHRIIVDAEETPVANGHDLVDILSHRFSEICEEEGMPAAVRVEVLGETRAHGQFAGDTEKWINEVRSAGIESGHGNIWVEKVVFETAFLRDEPKPGYQDAALDHLMGFIDGAAKEDENLVQQIRKEVQVLRKSLPPEVGGSILPEENQVEEWIRMMIRGSKKLIENQIFPQEQKERE